MAAATLATLAPTPGRSEAPVVPPPMAKADTIRVERGTEVEIPLRAGGRTPGPLRFLVRQPPRYGSLGEPRLVKPNEAVVTYKHDGRSGAPVDAFRFAAQAADSPVSAAAEIRIMVTEPPLRPSFPESLDFGDILAGQSTDRELTIRNTRGGAGSLQIDIPAPWASPQGKSIDVPAGGTVKFPVTFQPASGGRFDDFLRLRWTDKAAAIRLTGVALDLFLVSLSGENAQITSRSADPLLIELEGPPGLDVPASITIPPMGRSTIPLKRKDNHAGGVQGSLTLAAGSTRKSFPVSISAPAARLISDPSDSIDFGRVGVGSPARSRIHLRNSGGQPATFRTASEEGLRLIPPPDQIVLAPGASEEFLVEFLPAEAGSANGALEFVGPGNVVLLTLPWKAAVAAQAGSPPSSPIADSPAPVPAHASTDSDEPAPPAESPAPTPRAPRQPGPPLIEDLRITSSSSNRMQVAWREPKPKPEKYSVERREVVFVSDNEPPKEKWIPWDGIILNREDDTARATFVRLPPNASWFIRIQALDANCQITATTPVFRIYSQPRPSRAYIVWLTLAALAIAAAFFWKWKQRRSARQIKSSSDPL